MKKQTVSLLVLLLAASGFFFSCGNIMNKNAGALEFDSIQVNETAHLFGDTAKPACNLIINLTYASKSSDEKMKDSLNTYFLSACFGEKYMNMTAEEAVKKYTGKDPFKGINPDECVAMGAALQGGVLNKEVTGLLLLDVTPLSLGIETAGGVCTRMIERNKTIPTKHSQIFSTYSDNQPSVDINILQGEREFAKDNKSIGTFRLDGIAPAPRGIPQIEVTFDIDANGIVNVSAKDLGTGKEQHISITASTNMSKDDIDKAVKEAEAFAAEDKKKKEEVEARNAADQMVYQTEKSMNEFGDKVTQADKDSVNPKLDALKEALKGTDVEAIKKAQEELQTAFYAVAERIYKEQGAAAQQAEAAQTDVQGEGTNAAGGSDDNVVDADYTDAN